MWQKYCSQQKQKTDDFIRSLVHILRGNTTLGLSAALKDLKEQVQLHSSYQARSLLSVLEVTKKEMMDYATAATEWKINFPLRENVTLTQIIIFHARWHMQRRFIFSLWFSSRVERKQADDKNKNKKKQSVSRLTRWRRKEMALEASPPHKCASGDRCVDSCRWTRLFRGNFPFRVCSPTNKLWTETFSNLFKGAESGRNSELSSVGSFSSEHWSFSPRWELTSWALTLAGCV